MKKIVWAATMVCLGLNPALGQDQHVELDSNGNGAASSPASAKRLRYGKPQYILTDEGPISFGLILSAEVVSWSAPDAKDILVVRCWDGAYLYPSKDLKEIGPPIKLCGTLGLSAPGGRMFFLCTADDFPDQPSTIVIGNRPGGLFRLKKVGEYPNLKLEMVGRLKDSTTKLPFNIPFTNPNYEVDDAGGYLNLDYFNYVFPIFYPGPKGSPPGLIIGDWGGNLWWLPRQDTGRKQPLFAGTSYKKSDGSRFVKPELKAGDENGKPLLLGFAVEKGKRADGGVTRPAYYKNEHAQSDDLLVLCGTGPNELLYLKRVPTASNGSPSFTNLGPVKLTGGESEEYDTFAYHARVAVFERGGWNHLLISRGCNLAVYENEKLGAQPPAFRFSHWLTGRDVPLRGWNYTEILRSDDGKRYLLENDNYWCFREVRSDGSAFRVSSEDHPLYDQNGVFRADSETDTNHTTHWGFHRAALWDYDSSDKQHLIVGSDGGHLYLLRQDKPLGVNGRFEFTSFGPLKDSTGKKVRVHSRVVAAPVDLNGDGRLDLVLGGASYQLGVHTDPTPGAGIYYALNRGVDENGVPVLSPLQPLDLIGYEPPIRINKHYQLQSIDLLGNGERLVIVASQVDKARGRVYRVAPGRIALEYTGIVLPELNIEERILDLNGDGKWEYVRSGSERLIGTYAPLLLD